MKTIPDIFRAFGGLLSFAEDTGINYSTVRSMSARKSIAAHYWPKIVKAAEKKGIEGVTFEALAKIRARQAKRAK